MNSGVPQTYKSPSGDCLAAIRRPLMRVGAPSRVGLLLLAPISMLIFASSALGASGTGRSGSPEHHESGTGCPGMGHGGSGKQPPIVPSPPVSGGSQSGDDSGAGTGTATSVVVTPAAAVAAPLALPATTSVPPPAVPKSTLKLKRPAVKSTLKRPRRKSAKKRGRKHHAQADGGSSERTFARSALPHKRPAFTG